MPKTKLNEQKRDALRKDIQSALKAGTQQARIFETLSKKYGVSTEGIRYHLNALKGKKIAKSKPPSAQGSGMSAVKATKEKSLKNSKSQGHHQIAAAKVSSKKFSAVRISDAVKGLTAKDLERALEARKLIPAIEAGRASALSLRAKARDAERQVAQLERQFKKLVK